MQHKKSTHGLYPQGNSHNMQEQIIQCNDEYAIIIMQKTKIKINHDKLLELNIRTTTLPYVTDWTDEAACSREGWQLVDYNYVRGRVRKLLREAPSVVAWNKWFDGLFILIALGVFVDKKAIEQVKVAILLWSFDAWCEDDDYEEKQGYLCVTV